MNLLQRLENTFSYFKTGFEKDRYSIAKPSRLTNTKKTPLRFTSRSTDQPQWSMTDYETFGREGFEANSVIYAAIMVKVRAIGQIDLKAASGEIDSPEDIEPTNTRRDFTDNDTVGNDGQRLANLLNRPNKYMSGSEFQQIQTAYLNITGNAFTFIERNRGDNVPKALWPLNPANVQIVPMSNGELRGYIYKPKGLNNDEGLPILSDDMMHVKLPNPNDPLQGLGFGLSPILPLAKSADVDNQITSFLKVFFEHGAMPSGALKLKDMMADEDMIEQIKERFMATYGNYENWADIAVLDMTMDYERIGLTFDEMDFSNLDGRNESRMLLPFGVPAELMPIRLGLEGSTFANKEEARRWFWQDTMMYELGLFMDEYRAYLTTDDNVFPRWDTSKVEALKQNLTEQITGAVALIQNGVPPKIAFETVGLDIEQYEGFDKPREIPSPFGGFGDEPNNNDEPDALDNETPKDNTKKDTKSNDFLDDKPALYEKLDSFARSYEPSFGEAAGLALEEEKRQILSIIQQAKKKSIEQKASLNNVELRSDISDYLFGDGKDNWREKFFPVVTTEVEDLGTKWLDQLGSTFSVRNIEGEAWFEDYMLVFANPITDTSNKTIHDVIALSLEEGWSNDQLANRIGDVYDVWLTGDIDKVDWAWWHNPAARPFMGNRTLQWRRELIARTETTRAANAGANSLFENWGVTEKEWLATSDNRTRPHHRVMSGDKVPVNGKFMSGLGNKLRYPGDPDAPLVDTAQCRCTILPYGDLTDDKIDDTISNNAEDAIHYQDFKQLGVGRDNQEFTDYKNYWNNFIADNWTSDEISALKTYTGMSYRDYNRWVRGLKPRFGNEWSPEISSEFEKIKRNLSSGLKKSKLQTNQVLYRNVDPDFLTFHGLKEDFSDIDKLTGMVLNDKTVLSTSVHGKTFSSSKIQFEISAKKGTTGAYVDQYSVNAGELEVLIEHDNNLEVTRIERIMDINNLDRIWGIKVWANLL